MGFADKPKPGPAVTVRETVVFAVTLPEVPVTVMVDVPGATVAPTVSVRTLLVVDDVGLNAAVTPAGRPEALNVTVPVNPLSGLTLMVLVPLEPCGTETLVGAAESVKLGEAARLYSQMPRP